MQMFTRAFLAIALTLGAAAGMAGCAPNAQAGDPPASPEAPEAPRSPPARPAGESDPPSGDNQIAELAASTYSALSDDDMLFEIGYKNLLPPQIFHDDYVVAVGDAPREAMEQPIAFTHQKHVQGMGLDCNFCHSNARKGIHAGVPAVQVCMGCHALVDTKDRPELEKLKGYWERGEAIPWNKVHDLPDYVYFSHKRHVTGGVQCTECHGDVQNMTVNQRVASLKMGWCLDCHAQHPKVDENYGTKAELRRAELKDCWTCHK